MPANGPLDRIFRAAQARATVSIARSRSEHPAATTTDEITGQPETPCPSHAPSAYPRPRHHVNTLLERFKITRWMVSEASQRGPKKIISKAVTQFPRLFTGTGAAKLEKGRRWWNSRSKTVMISSQGSRAGQFVSMSTSGQRRISRKAVHGRGPKQAMWTCKLQEALLEEFERLSAAGLKFSPAVLQQLSRDLISSAPIGSDFHSSVLYNGVPIDQKVTVRWIQHFMVRRSIVLREQTGKLMTSPEKKALIEKEVAFHLGVLRRGFLSGRFKEDDMENADETHFIFNMDNGKTLGFRGSSQVKYADVVSGGENFTMMVRITGGSSARVEVPFIVFRNKSRSYPIRVIEDTVPEVCYRTQPKGWMDAKVFLQWLSEPRALPRKVGNERQLFVDNCGGHYLSDDVSVKLGGLNTKLHKFPANATDLVQPADSFVIQKLKDLWRKHWEFYKGTCVQENRWTLSSGCLPNPGKKFYLELCARVVREFNALRDKDGIRYGRKAMIRTGMSLNVDGLWLESQLSGELQEIIAKHRDHFDGTPVHCSSADIETETDDE